MRSKEEWIALFRARGMRMTPQRERVFEVLSHAMGHPTAEDVWKAVRADLPTVSLKTIYDILHELVSLGELKQLNLGPGSSRYEAADLNHNHFYCVSCGTVSNSEEVTGQASPPASTGGAFMVTHVEVVYKGICADCQARRQAAQAVAFI